MSPLHIATKNKESDDVVLALLKKHPDAAKEPAKVRAA